MIAETDRRRLLPGFGVMSPECLRRSAFSAKAWKAWRRKPARWALACQEWWRVPCLAQAGAGSTCR